MRRFARGNALAGGSAIDEAAEAARVNVLTRPADHEHMSALFLVSILGRHRERPASQIIIVNHDRNIASAPGRVGIAHDLGAAAMSGATVMGAPASSSGATKFTRRTPSFPLRPFDGSNEYDVTAQFGTSARRSMARICGSSIRSRR